MSGSVGSSAFPFEFHAPCKALLDTMPNQVLYTTFHFHGILSHALNTPNGVCCA